jgi:hypothetical protein
MSRSSRWVERWKPPGEAAVEEGVDGARYTDALDRSIRGAERLLERIDL